MSSGRPNKPFQEMWLKRTSRELAASGKISQVALSLSLKSELSKEEWELRLRAVLDRTLAPSLDFITQVDAVLASPSKQKRLDERMPDWFDSKKLI